MGQEWGRSALPGAGVGQEYIACGRSALPGAGVGQEHIAWSRRTLPEAGRSTLPGAGVGQEHIAWGRSTLPEAGRSTLPEVEVCCLGQEYSTYFVGLTDLCWGSSANECTLLCIGVCTEEIWSSCIAFW